MLLKFNQPDMLNTELVDAASGRPKYTILSRASYILGKDNVIVGVASRFTSIVNTHGDSVATIEWTGRDKKSGGLIRIMDGEPIKFADLFSGCDSVNAAPGSLLVPSRLGYIWVATRNSLLVCSSDTREVVATFHERCVQLRNSLSPSPIPKVGSDYLEFEDLPENVIAELLVGFVFMNIMRRTRFDLPRYQFPLIDGYEGERQSMANVLTHMKESLVRRTASFRRNTL